MSYKLKFTEFDKTLSKSREKLADFGTEFGFSARFISTRKYVREQFLRSHEMARKKAQIRRPDLFQRECISENNF